MNRKFKVLGVAFVAALALTAVMASAASAQFTSSAAHTTLLGNQVEGHKFTAGSGFGSITCETAIFHGTQSGTNVAEITIEPTYAKCKDSFGRTVHIVTNTLLFHFKSGANKGKVTLTGHIQLTVTTGGTHCTINISGKQDVNGITYTNNAGGTVSISTHSNNITSTSSGGFFACGSSASHSSTGTYTGTTLVKGTDTGGKQVNISVH